MTNPRKFLRYEITSCYIKQYPGVSREVWFLDSFERDEKGYDSRSNICSGTQEYCLKIRNARILAALPPNS